MMSKEILKYSLKNLTHRKGRSLLTIFSIFIGITTIFIFLSFGLGLYSYANSFLTESSADKVTIQPRGAGAIALEDEFALTEDDLDAIDKTSGVYETSGMVMKVAEVKRGNEKKYSFLVAHDPDKKLLEEFSGVKIHKGRGLRSNDRGNVVLGYNYLLDNKIFERGLEINDIISINDKNLRIVGFFESLGNPQDDAQIYLNLDYVDSVYPDSKNNYGMIIARVDVDNMDNVVDNIEKSLRKSRGLEEGKEDFYVASFAELFETYNSALNSIIGFVVLIALISVFVSAINTANTMITSVLERIKEIGVIKSIGSGNSEIFNIFLIESSFLGLVAGTLGAFVGFIIVFAVGSILIGLGWGFLAPSYPWYLFFGCVLFAVLTGAISGVLPAINASRINPVDALRYE